MEFIAKFQGLVELIDPDPTDIPVRDEDDRVFLDLIATHPPVEFFITGDRDFERKRYADVPVISASAFVKAVLTKHG